MVRLCPPTLALPSALVSGVKWAGKIPNISLESSSQTAGTITEKAAAPGMEAYETGTKPKSTATRPACALGILFTQVSSLSEKYKVRSKGTQHFLTYFLR